jgi:transcription elongation factor Elf1
MSEDSPDTVVSSERPTDEVAVATDAFGALGNETRMGILRSLFAAERAAGTTVTRPFSTLYEASDESTTAGFAYHLRQLTDTYLRKVSVGGDEDGASDEGGAGGDGDATEGYRLTAAGRRVARAIAAGTLTESVDREPLALSESCPFCGTEELSAAGDDSVLTVACGACDREVLALPFPPGGYQTHDDGSLPAAVDRFYRARIGTMRDGTCPECGGAVETAAELVDEEDTAGTAEPTPDDRPVARARMSCRTCGYRLRCPVALTLLDEPAVVSAFHAAGVGLDDRPLWNVGPEWGERVVSTDPLAVRVTARVGDEEVACFVGRDLSVVHTDRASDDDSDGEGRRSGIDSAAGTETIESGSETGPGESRAEDAGTEGDGDAGTATA